MSAQLFEARLALFSLWGILSKIANDCTLERMYLMIDALDECNTGLVSLLTWITRSALGMSEKVKWVISSRNEPRIRELLESGNVKQHISLEQKREDNTTGDASSESITISSSKFWQRFRPSFN